MLAAALDGIERGLEAPKPLNNINLYHLDAKERRKLGVKELPGSLAEALTELEKDTLLTEALGEVTCEAFMRAKWEEWNAAIAGKEKIMMKIMDPVDPVVAGGTFSGNLMGCAAGIAALTIMDQPGFFETWLKRVDNFYAELQTIFDEADFPAIVQGLGCTFGIYIGTREPIRNYHDIAERTNPKLYNAFFSNCIKKGLYYHTDFTISAQHDDELLAKSADLMRDAVRDTKESL